MIHPDDRLKTFYEWVAEEVTDDEYQDIVDCNYCETFKEAKKWAQGKNCQIALVWSTRTEASGLEDREYAYIDDGVLPVEFDNGKKIPKRFHQEIASYVN